MEAKYKQIYDSLGAADKKAFRAALASNDRITINSYVTASGLPKLLDDIPDNKRSGAGRPSVAAIEYSKNVNNEKKRQFTAIKNDAPGLFDDLKSVEDFAGLYNSIIDNVCEDFYNNYPELVKKTPFMWYNTLLIELKKQLPPISVKDAQRVGVAWDAFTALMYKIGLYPTMEAFTCLTGIYRSVLNNQLTTAHVELKKKIFEDCRDNMAAQVAYNPMTQVNKLFLLKSVYGFSENGNNSQQITEQTNKTIDDIPIFSIEDKQKEQ